MYCITFEGKPATLEALYAAENAYNGAGYRSMGESELNACLTSTSRQGVIELYIHYFGFTWKERANRVDVTRLELCK